jgi:hypothetical protein
MGEARINPTANRGEFIYIMQARSDSSKVAGLARFGINTSRALGTNDFGIASKMI